MSWFKKRNKNKIDDLRIVEVINDLGEKTYDIERYTHSSSFDLFPSRNWSLELTGFYDYDTTVERMEELDTRIKRDKVVSKRVVS